MDFWGDNCTYCEYYTKIVFTDPKVVKALERFECIAINIDEDKAAKAKYEVKGKPTIMFFDSQGRNVGYITGEKTTEEFLALLEKAK